MKKPLVIFLVGPTASGKSALGAVLAEKINAEIISADSMQIYKGMNIGTAKPTAAEKRLARHHLIDILSPAKNFSVYEFRKKALQAIQQIIRKRKTPLIVGGTGLYVRALIDGLSSQPGADLKIRERLQKEAEQDGLEKLYSKLREVDPARAAEIKPQDQKRIIRALEIYKLSGKTPTEWREDKEPGLSEMGWDVFVIGINRDRGELYKRIERRVDKMFRDGFAAEVKRLLKKKVSMTASQAVGYREIADALSGKITMAEARAATKLKSRHFAKRQMTWFRKEKGIIWLEWKNEKPAEKAAEILSLIQKSDCR